MSYSVNAGIGYFQYQHLHQNEFGRVGKRRYLRYLNMKKKVALTCRKVK